MLETPVNPPIAESLSVHHHPEIAFQSFRLLNGEAGYRNAQRDAFIAGDIANPTLDYPHLSEEVLGEKAGRLNRLFSVIDSADDPLVRATTWDSASYRLADMYWAMSAADIVRTHKRRSPQELDALVARTQALNEQLFGKPEIGIAKAISAEVWAQIDAKDLSPKMQKLKHELAYGTTVTAEGVEIPVAPLMRHEGERLPQIPKTLLDSLREELLRRNPDIVQTVRKHWEHIQQTRPEDKQHFTPQDVFAIFNECHTQRDPEGTTGVGIVYDPSATATSWDPARHAVVVGGNRAPVEKPESMLGIVLHEYGVHGVRAIEGSTTSMPPLGTGMFTEADPGEMSDYVTFEEGLASMGQMAISGKGTRWNLGGMDKYLGIVLAYEGRDFRQTYETLWRLHVLMDSKDGGEPTTQRLATLQRNAYTSCVRIFRGTPTDMPRTGADGSPRVLTYNKDMAYLKGKLQVIEFWNRYGNDPEMIDLIFKAKIDPLNKRHLAVARTAFNSALVA